MQTTVIAKGDLYVRMSVCLSVTFWHFVQMNGDMIVRASISDRTIILLSGEVKFIRIFAGDNRLTCTANAYVHQFYCFRSVFM